MDRATAFIDKLFTGKGWNFPCYNMNQAYRAILAARMKLEVINKARFFLLPMNEKLLLRNGISL